MDIENLTIGQAKQLAALFGQVSGGAKPCGQLGKYVVVRTYSAGVHIGVLRERAGKEVVLGDARRLWSWSGALTLNESDGPHETSERDALRADLATARIKALNDAADYITGYAAAVRRAGYLDTERALMSVHESIVEMAARAGGGGT